MFASTVAGYGNMNQYLWITVVLLAVGAVALLFVVRLAGSKNAPQKWRVRCRKCGKTKLVNELGIVRFGAFGSKPLLVKCGTCKRLRWAILERIPGQVSHPKNTNVG